MEGLAEVYAGPFFRDASLGEKTSFRLGGRADWLFEPRDHAETGALLAFLAARALPVTVLGEGSNVLVRDGGIRGAVLRVTQAMGGLAWEGDLARCGAGLPSRSLARRALDAGRGGFEWAATLPGNLGGALAGNAGAFGGDLADSFHACRGWRLSGVPLALGRDEVDFAYRFSSLPEDAVVTEVTLRLPPLGPDERRAAKERYAEAMKRRASTQPGGRWTAGSTFKNPPGDAAGRLIEACGLKGYTVGGARVSELHANFIVVDREGARAFDVEALIDTIRATVSEKTGIALETEVRILGEA